MDIRDIITSFLAPYDLDIRKSQYARFTDQKCTPDIVSFLADCIMNIVATKPVFTMYDIWQSQYFITNTRAFFNKPWANDARAKHEYDKVLAQPLNLLAYAHVIKEVDGSKRCKAYVIENKEMLDFISRRDHNAYDFLFCYFSKVLTDSDFMRFFEEYRYAYKNDLKSARSEIYERYRRLISGNTPTHSVLDIDRMFHKVFNVLACDYQVPGSKGEHNMMYSDLMYNRTNIRDIHKRKDQSRQEARGVLSTEEKAKFDCVSAYYIKKAIAQIRKIESCSEVHDSFGSGEATQVHHIFPKHKYPQLASSLENLILLTGTQHFTKAHPSNKTQEVDSDYQRVCLLSKSESIEHSIENFGEAYYRKSSFVNVINEGLNLDLSTKTTFEEMRRQIQAQYRISIPASNYFANVADNNFPGIENK